MIHLQQTREEVSQNTFRLQEKIKNIYDRKTKAEKFQLEDVVLRWDARNEEKGNHGKFDNLWNGPIKYQPIEDIMHFIKGNGWSRMLRGTSEG